MQRKRLYKSDARPRSALQLSMDQSKFSLGFMESSPHAEDVEVRRPFAEALEHFYTAYLSTHHQMFTPSIQCARLLGYILPHFVIK